MYSGTKNVPDSVEEQLFGYFRMKKCILPPDIKSFHEIAVYLNERTDLILSPVTLERDWYRVAAGPVLAQTVEETLCVAVPDWLGRYYFIDHGTHQRVYLSAANSDKLQPDAYAVALAFPQETISMPALLRGLFRGVSAFEGAALALWCVLGSCVMAILSELVSRAVRASVVSVDGAQLWGQELALVFVLLLGLMMLLSGERIFRRMIQKAALAILPGLGERAYFMRAPTGSTACLADLRENAQRLMAWVLYALCSVVMVLTLAWFLGQTSAAVLGVALLIALVLFAAAAAVCRVLSQAEEKNCPEEILREWFVHKVTDRRFGIQRPFPQQKNGVEWETVQMFLVPASLVLLLPLVFVTIRESYSAMRFFRLLSLYLPVTALPLRVLFQAPQAGRAAAGIRPLLSAKYLSSGEVDLPPLGSVLELQDVKYSYPDRARPVLREVNLRLLPGEIVGILGDTGSGKSTLARLMTGDLKPTGGNVYYGGVELARHNHESVLRRIAFGSGEDIRLLDDQPQERDGRACVVFSTRESKLAACDRILRLVDGKLVSL